MRPFAIPYVVCTKILATRYSTAEGGELSTATRYSTWTPEGAQDVVPLDIVCRRRRLRQLVALTQDIVRGTRSVAQDLVCPPQAVRRYVTLTLDIVP